MNMGGQSQQFKMGTDNVWNFGFNAAMPLVNASLWKAIQISDTQILSALEDARSSKLDMVNNINKAYYSWLLAIASRDVIRPTTTWLVNADIFQKQFEQGTASEYDVLRSSVQVKNVEPELLQADIAIRQCALQLKVLMGMDSEVEIAPDVTLAEMQQEMYGYSLGASGTSLANNSTMRSLAIQEKLLDQNVTLKKFAWIPSLGVQYNINWNAMSSGNPFNNQRFNPYSTVALAVSVPIFNGTGRLHAVKQAEIQRKELTLNKENVESSLNMQVRLALDNIDKEVRQIASSEEGVRQAAKANEIMQKSFEIGAASYLDLRDAELANTSARLAYLQAIYNYLVSTSELDTLLGREDALGISTYNKAK